MKHGHFLTDIMRAVSFLSRIPVHDAFFKGETHVVARTTHVFPLAGCLIALPSALVAFALTSLGADPFLSATLTIGLCTVLTGALHEDGFADVIDGFGGGRTRERILEIMKDSRIGAYGALALSFSFLIRVAALAVLMRELTPVAVAGFLIVTACLSRGLIVWHWNALPSARETGVAAAAGQPDEGERNKALIYASGISLVLILLLALNPFVSTALVLPFIAVIGFNRLCIRKIGGHTGDTIGAAQQITEIVILATLALTI